MKRDQVTLGEVYAVKASRGVHRAVILSKAPHELVHRFRRGDDQPGWELREDSGHYSSYGQVRSGGAFSPSAITRGVPVVLANSYGPGAAVPTSRLEELASAQWPSHFLGRRDDFSLEPGVRITVIRPQDVLCTWDEHEENERAKQEREAAELDDRRARRAASEAAADRVHALLDRLDVEVTPKLQGGYTRQDEWVFRSCSWESLEKLLIQVAEAGANRGEQFRLDREESGS